MNKSSPSDNRPSSFNEVRESSLLEHNQSPSSEPSVQSVQEHIPKVAKNSSIAAVPGSSTDNANKEEDVDWLSKIGPSYAITVDTFDPFSRKKNKTSASGSSSGGTKTTIHRAQRKPSKGTLKPGSCASALNLMAWADEHMNNNDLLSRSSSRQGSMSSSLHLLRRDSSGSSTDSSRSNLLSPDSCASILSLLNRSDSFRNISVRRSHQIHHAPQRASGLLGNARLATEADDIRRLNRGSNRSCGGSNNRNAEWDVFE
jgi:hypothetical protein